MFCSLPLNTFLNVTLYHYLLLSFILIFNKLTLPTCMRRHGGYSSVICPYPVLLTLAIRKSLNLICVSFQGYLLHTKGIITQSFFCHLSHKFVPFHIGLFFSQMFCSELIDSLPSSDICTFYFKVPFRVFYCV